ncbi:MAG: DUF192 domain-containing protein [Arenicellales bacterium]
MAAKYWLLAILMLAAPGVWADCQESTAALDSMAETAITLQGPGDRSIELPVRIADDNRERGGGFQYICPQTINTTSIYFEFDRAYRPSFHMHNVEAPLDIAFVDPHGVILDIQRMEPYTLGATHYRYYSPPGEVMAALETRAGYFEEKGITAGDWSVKALQ